MDEKPSRRRFRFGLLALFALLAAAGVVATLWNPFPKPSKTKLSSIEIGMTEADVARLVGNPDEAVTDSAGRLLHVYSFAYGEGWIVAFVDGKVTACDQFFHSPVTPPP
jgi:hypothetical protein